MPFPTMQSLFDPFYPPGLQWYWRGDFVKELTDEAIKAHLAQASKSPSPHSMMHLYPIDGAVQRMGKSDTAWNTRDATWCMVIAGVDADPQKAGELTRWTKGYWDAIHPFSNDGGGYVNFMMDDGDERRLRATYGDNYDRLVALKGKYDPANFFSVNTSGQTSLRHPAGRAAGPATYHSSMRRDLRSQNQLLARHQELLGMSQT